MASDSGSVGSNRVLRAAGAMGLGTFFSRILGLVREQVFAVLFGAGNATDAFYIAFRIPNLLRDLFAEGAMSAALVPTFTRVRKQEGDRRAWRLAGLVFRVLFVVVGILALVGIWFSPELVTLYASSYREVPGKFELTVFMTQIMFPFFPLVALAAAFMGVLNACGRFFVPAFASALFNLTSIISGVLLALFLPRYGVEPIVGMAIGVVLGGAIQAFSQLPLLYRQGYRYPAKLPEDRAWNRDPALKNMVLLMLPGMVGLAATQVNVLVNSILATSEGAGAVSWLNYAFRLMQFPIGIFGVSLAAATLPRVSAQWVDREFSGCTETLTRSLKQVFAINFPASAGLAFLGIPIIQLLFEYGEFQHSDTRATAAALAAYALGLTAYSAVKVLVPVCYAVDRTRIAVISSVLSVILTIILNILMVKPFGFVGLALGTSAAALLNAVFLLGALKKVFRFKGAELPLAGLLGRSLVHFLLAVCMGAACYFSWVWLERWLPDQQLQPFFAQFAGFEVAGIVLMRLLRVSILVAEGFFVVVLLARVFKVQETVEILQLLGRKLKKRG